MQWCLGQGRPLSEAAGGRTAAAVIFVPNLDPLFIIIILLIGIMITLCHPRIHYHSFYGHQFIIPSPYSTFHCKFWEDTKITSDSEFLFSQSLLSIENCQRQNWNTIDSGWYLPVLGCPCYF